MIVIFGLAVLLAAVIVGTAGVLSNSGDEHALTDRFAVFGYHVTGSTGTLFLYGIVVGAVGLLGLGPVACRCPAGLSRGRLARHDLKGFSPRNSGAYRRPGPPGRPARDGRRESGRGRPDTNGTTRHDCGAVTGGTRSVTDQTP